MHHSHHSVFEQWRRERGVGGGGVQRGAKERRGSRGGGGGGGRNDGVHGGFLQRSWRDTQHEQGEAASP